MAQSSRLTSISGNYHIILRGINKQRIFEAPQDYAKFLSVLDIQIKKHQITLFAWCLMSNHVHLLIKERENTFGSVMIGLAAAYVRWFNNKYHRTGQLFENRFRSEPIDDEIYFLKVTRYIHMNPVKAGICREPSEYPYSSCAKYLNNGSDDDLLFGLVLRSEFRQYHREKAEDHCLDIDDRPVKTKTDEQAIAIIKSITGLERPAMATDLPEDKRDAAVFSMLKSGVYAKQISRLTGIPLGIIEYIRDKH